MEAIRSSETSVLIRATRCHFPEDDNHHSHRRGNLKSYAIWVNTSNETNHKRSNQTISTLLLFVTSTLSVFLTGSGGP
jgi:hypothetical protein